MDAALEDELRALRVRAYGRDADLAHDPEAVARLRELEAFLAASPSKTAADGGEGDDPRAPDADASVDGATDEVSPARSDESDREQKPLRARRRGPAAYVASMIAVAAIASGVTWGVARIAPVETSSGAPQIATLEPNATSAPPPDFGIAPDSPVWDFHGLTVFRAQEGTPEGAAECLWLWVPDGPSSDDNSSGWGLTGCAAGSFPAAITIPLSRVGLPTELLAAFPDGAAIQFVLDGDRVGVFLDSE